MAKIGTQKAYDDISYFSVFQGAFLGAAGRSPSSKMPTWEGTPLAQIPKFIGKRDWKGDFSMYSLSGAVKVTMSVSFNPIYNEIWVLDGYPSTAGVILTLEGVTKPQAPKP